MATNNDVSVMSFKKHQRVKDRRRSDLDHLPAARLPDLAKPTYDFNFVGNHSKGRSKFGGAQTSMLAVPPTNLVNTESTQFLNIAPEHLNTLMYETTPMKASQKIRQLLA